MAGKLSILLFFLLAAQPAITAAPQADYKGKTLMDGAFTEAQALRGEAAYTSNCGRCHGVDLMGNQAPLKNQRFVDRWREEKVDLVFGAIKTLMPRGAPGSLSDSTYLDIISYILQQNDYPVGSEELTPANMSAIQFVGKQGPQAVPNLSIVQVTGCLTSAPNGVWNLAKGTEPIRARRAEETTTDDVKVLENVAPASHTYRLNTDNLTAPFDPVPHAGHKMYLKGVLNRQSTSERINVTAITMVSETCAP